MARRPTKKLARAARNKHRPEQASRWLRVSGRELATILAALRFYQDENLQGDQVIPDSLVKQIATKAGTVEALRFDEVSRLRERLNLGHDESHGRGGKRLYRKKRP